MPRKKDDDAPEDSAADAQLGVNLVVLQGHLSSDPVSRELPSGEEVLNIEVTTPTGLGRLSVPVVSDPIDLDLQAGSEVVVVGHVRRRFFRGGAGVQSRTEVVAETIVLASHRAKVRKTLNDAIEYLG